MTLREDIARAICHRRICKRGPLVCRCEENSALDFHKTLWQEHLPEADAVLEVLRSPEMQDRIVDLYRECYDRGLSGVAFSSRFTREILQTKPEKHLVGETSKNPRDTISQSQSVTHET